MTNLQQSAPRISGRLLRRVWFFAPVAAGGLVAALLAGSLLIPQWLAFRRDAERLSQLEALREEVTLLRGQLKVLDQNEEEGEAQKARLVEVVIGQGDPSTFLAMLDREARATGVQLDLYEPQAPSPAATPPTPRPDPAATPAPAGQPLPGANAPAAPGTPPAAVSPESPIEIEGLQRRTVLMAARGSYPALLAFLRRVEALSILVVQNDLSLSLDEPKSVDPKGISKPPAVVLKLAFSIYTKPPEANPATAAAAAPPAGAPPAAAPAPPPAPATPPR
jgi:type IV pilus assembly protein PilO